MVVGFVITATALVGILYSIVPCSIYYHSAILLTFNKITRIISIREDGL